MTTPSLASTDVEAIARRTAELLRAEPIKPLTVDIRGVMALLSFQSSAGAYTGLKALNIKPILRGKYYVRDIENAVARRAIANRNSL